ncbi:acetyl-CoA C-acetyltransferase [Cohnella ginsengisoli]|uniref:acetyl-CoA C-acetyltransferase n=1 Tax=Cohnella ginsengisoli TaxID=425004 RepID=A0A9X4QPS6_9BACL|nr:acetyl-CoA C-acetyltransferase [Cohnella ginsengisoli]MDG0793807.1 acetyl-CoA C-acetyltransferase [Cohnella ginsengisoli]
MSDHDVVIVSAVRTPIGRLNGMFKDLPAVSLGAAAIRSAIDRAGIPASIIEEVYMGNVLQAGLGQNPARQAALEAGVPVEAPATTVNQVCGSGLMSVYLASRAIQAGDCDAAVAGGMESMSQAPYLLQGARTGYAMGDRTLTDSMIKDGLWCAANDYHMGITAENLCAKFALTRDQLDEIAFASQRKAAAAADQGVFADELVGVSLPGKKQPFPIAEQDEHPRPDTTPDTLAKLRPAFKPDGIVTAGNASGINDGAAALVLMSGKTASEKGLRPLGVIRSFAVAGVDPAYMGMGPIPAVEKALRKAQLPISDIDLIEVNEAFAAQVIPFIRHFGLDEGKVNVNGGAIALGHPIGASGARVLVTLLHEMNRRRSRFGLAALCIGGGQGIAAIVERCG